MRGPNDFWLSYHELLEAYKSEGATPDARTTNIVEQFHRLPPSVRSHIVDDMADFLTVMAELHVAVRSDGDGAPIRKPQQQT
jgi:hypothetical protein